MLHVKIIPVKKWTQLGLHQYSIFCSMYSTITALFVYYYIRCVRTSYALADLWWLVLVTWACTLSHKYNTKCEMVFVDNAPDIVSVVNGVGLLCCSPYLMDAYRNFWLFFTVRFLVLQCSLNECISNAQHGKFNVFRLSV